MNDTVYVYVCHENIPFISICVASEESQVKQILNLMWEILHISTSWQLQLCTAPCCRFAKPPFMPDLSWAQHAEQEEKVWKANF